MLKRVATVAPFRDLFFAAGLLAISVVPVGAQDRLKTMPGYDRYERMSPLITAQALRMGTPAANWTSDGQAVEYEDGGKWYRYDLASRRATAIPTPADPSAAGRGGAGRGGRGAARPERGRQYESGPSPDGAHLAFYRDRNFWISNADGSGAVAVTTDGNLKARTKYGTGSWVYGEELNQVTAFWWSPDGKKVAYYRFDESGVPDYYLQMKQTGIYDSLDIEAYPKVGYPNPVVELFVYDMATKKSTKIDVRDGKPFANDVVGYYVYQIEWSPDGTEITFNRTNRRQNILEYTACSPDSGKCRSIVREEWPTGWVENHPPKQFLKDNKRFLWMSERNGFKNYYLYDWTGKLLTTVTNNQFEAQSLVKLDEQAGVLWYTARDGDNFMKTQLHRVGLDGTGDKRLTDPAFMHTVTLSPDAKYFIDVAQTHDTPPATRLMDADGKLVAELGKTDVSKFNELGLKKAEMFTYKAADGVTTLHGMIQFPSNFDPAKKYPALASVYGGPASAASSEMFRIPSATTEYGFLVLTLDSRAVPGMGKRSLDAIYEKLGQVEMDDMAEGVKALWNRPYFDKNRVGIHGTSYGGYSAAMEIVRHPEVFAAASSSSPVTDWRHYDTIYTERYMWIPDENKEGYDKGSVMTYVANLRGRLLLYYGTADNNVHPNNSMQLIKALQDAGKSFEVQVGPDVGHSGVNGSRMMEFFIENLVMKGGVAGTN